MNAKGFDGGPAFPLSVGTDSAGGRVTSADFMDAEGMSLRDYFAGQALCRAHGMNPAQAAEWAYCIADALIVERAKAEGRS